MSTNTGWLRSRVGRLFLRIAPAVVVLTCGIAVSVAGADAPATSGQILIRFRADAVPSAVTPGLSRAGVTELRTISPGASASLARWRKATLAAGTDLAAALTQVRSLSAVERASTNPAGKSLLVPNDPLFPQQISLDDPIAPRGDIGAVLAWNKTTGSADVVVAVVDTGVDYTHPDLAPNMWTNPLEAAGLPGVDDDGNGFVDDVHGYDFGECCSANPALCGLDPDWDAPDGDPRERFGNPLSGMPHGTPVAGIIGAAGNNAQGMSGVAWNVRIMAVKASEWCSFTCEQHAAAVDYAVTMGADIINASWTIIGECPLLAESVDRAQAAGVLVVVAAGDDPFDLDALSIVPQSLPNPNLVVVTGSSASGAFVDVLPYGTHSVDIAAPQASVSTGLSGIYLTPPGFGTSFSAPHVSGALALLKARAPGLDYLDLKGALLSGVVLEPSLSGITVSGGRLSASGALQTLDIYGANASQVLVCDDGIDNDHDGLIDWPADPQCAGQFGFGLSESPTPGCGLLGVEALALPILVRFRLRRHAPVGRSTSPS